MVKANPELVVAMLATASIGAIWSSCSPDFGFKGVMDRFGQIQPKVLFTADGYTYNGKPLDSLGRVSQVAHEIEAIEQVVRQVKGVASVDSQIIHVDPPYMG